MFKGLNIKMAYIHKRYEVLKDLTRHVKVKVKCSRYRSDVAQRVGRGIALLLYNCGIRRG